MEESYNCYRILGSLKYLLVCSFTTLVCSCSYLGIATRYELTDTELYVIGNQIETYYEEKNSLPQDINDTNIFADKTYLEVNDKDAWGRPYIWSKLGETGIKVISLGKDGKVGGEEENRDLETSFDYTREEPLMRPVPTRFYSKRTGNGPIHKP